MKIDPLVPRILCLFQTSLVWLPRIIRTRREKKSIPITNGRTSKKNPASSCAHFVSPGDDFDVLPSFLWCPSCCDLWRPTWHEIEFARIQNASCRLFGSPAQRTNKGILGCSANSDLFSPSFSVGGRDRKQLSSLPIIACVRAKWGIDPEGEKHPK